MFKLLAEEYVSIFSAFNLFNYITIRTGGAILTSLFFSLIFAQKIINSLSTIQPIGQPIRDDGPENHILKKIGTPTMGGVLIILSIIFSIILWADLNNNFIWISVFSCLSFGLIGFYDDYKKFTLSSSSGISGKTKLFWQILFAGLIVTFIFVTANDSIEISLMMPFLKHFSLYLGLFFFKITS